MNRHSYTLILVVILIIVGTIIGNVTKRGNNRTRTDSNIEDYILPENAIPDISEREVVLIIDTAQSRHNSNPMVRNLIPTFQAQGVMQAANISYTLNDNTMMDVRIYSMQDANRAASVYQQSKDNFAAEGVDYQENFGIGAEALSLTGDYGTMIRFYDEAIAVTINALSDDEDATIAFARAYREWVQAQLAK